MAKRKETVSTDVRGDKLEITPLGAGNEVGRSSVFMTFKGKNILVRTLVKGAVKFGNDGFLS